MTLEPHGINSRDVMNSVSDIYVFSSLSFSVFYVFKSRICNVHLLSVLFFLYSPRRRFMLQTEIWSKYNSPLYFLVFFVLFFYHSSCREDQFTVLSLKFGTQDCFTDPGLLKIRRLLIGLVVVVLPSQVFLLIVSLGPGSAVGKGRKVGNGEKIGKRSEPSRDSGGGRGREAWTHAFVDISMTG